MKDSFLCCAFCLGLGMVVGGVIVTNNPKIRDMIVIAKTKATDACETIKDAAEEKVAEVSQKMSSEQKNTQDKR